MTKRDERTRTYKRYLRALMAAKKDVAYKERLTMPTARQMAEYARAAVPGLSFTNVARDVRRLTSPGADYDAEFDVLWRGQVVPEVVARYSESYLAVLIKHAIVPGDITAKLQQLVQRRTRPDGRPIWEEV